MQCGSWRAGAMLERDTCALANRAPVPAPTAVLVASPAVACANPAVMCYGGVERVAWRLTRLLTLLGAEVVPVASADSTFGAGVPGRGLFAEEAWVAPDRVPSVYTEDVPAMFARFGAHVEAVVARERPDTVLLLGPSPAVLNGALRAAEAIGAQMLGRYTTGRATTRARYLSWPPRQPSPCSR